MLKNEYLVAKIGVDTAANEPLKIWGDLFSLFSPLLSEHLKLIEFDRVTYCYNVQRVHMWKSIKYKFEVKRMYCVVPNAERNLANFTKMDFEMHEPFGMTLIEKIRGSASVN